ncbi:hypothetical protein AQZ52_10910 [Novosphingobium fuchskuhlense]|uniref:Phage tail lysozyme domain-containing protein n=1 Tax=Novosphingobium fuchskuhlense TaxID=1117702 RepID=A0A117UUP0_9SPHN|nr:phage tail tip lysozyme [Novosphingobium fuchskuhlense]KUR71173.1 hypothetical protein AQZ52_10910 [Novosphingobium fuchskuhlense]
MSEHIIDAFVATFRLDTKGYKDGEREVDEGNKRLRDQSKKTFDGMEQAGRKTGEAIKSVSREVIGLGLAFLGARSITGFLANMATGAASADRFGNAIGMSVKQIWAWRQAVKSVGGQAGDADTALQTIQNARIGFRTGALDPAQQAAFGRLGITGNDLRDKDAGGILSKLAGSKLAGKDPQLYSALLQQIGLPQSTIYFLMQGKDSVDKLLKQYEASAKDAEKTAKEAENLQKEMADLNAQLQKALVPILNQIVPLLTELVKVLGGSVPGGGSGAGTQGGGSSWGIPGLFEFRTSGSGMPMGQHGHESEVYSFFRSKGLASNKALGITAALYAESGLDPDALNQKSGAYGLSQWLGNRKKELFRRYGNHPNLQQQLDFLWSELNGGDPGGAAVLAQRGLGTAPAMIGRFLRPAKGHETTRDLREASRFIGAHSRNGVITIHGGIHIKTAATDANGIARDMNSAVRRRMAVAQADPIVNP